MRNDKMITIKSKDGTSIKVKKDPNYLKRAWKIFQDLDLDSKLDKEIKKQDGK